ncbi:YdcF family protein [Actinomadura hibisca]|uniref:YdcF family protein n=1 Tax=Actinomadura hibisca TaxID=68565 RepID=UPI000836DBBB|nr:YdcF family protein [Actinomadura hibisca]
MTHDSAATTGEVTAAHLADAQLIWDYHLMGHELKPCSAAIGLGSHDLGVATFAAELFHQGLFKTLVFSGGNSPTTVAYFPRGEAVHYREHAIDLGVPNEAIIVEPQAANTGQNITYSRAVLAAAGIEPESLILISKPYMERRTFATARKLWPEAEVICTSEPLSLTDYLTSIGDEKLVIDMLVGDLQRVIEYPALGFAVVQDVPEDVEAAYHRLVAAGFTGRLLTTDPSAAKPAP